MVTFDPEERPSLLFLGNEGQKDSHSKIQYVESSHSQTTYTLKLRLRGVVVQYGTGLLHLQGIP